MKRKIWISTMIASAFSLVSCGVDEAKETSELNLKTPSFLEKMSISSLRLQEEKTQLVLMKAEPIIQGIRPYTGIWPKRKHAYLTGISIPQHAGILEVRLVKPGFTTNDCNRRSAVVPIRDGTSATPAQIIELFGTSKPTGPIQFAACIGISPEQQVNSFPLAVHYIKDEKPISNTDEWMISGNGGTIRSGSSISLKNTYYNHYVEYKKRKYGINLNWSKQAKSNFQFKSRSGGNIEFNEAFAIYVSGHGYLKYQSREYGINIVWDSQPRYEWRVKSKNDQGGSLTSNLRFTLINDVINEEVVYCRRHRGINLVWEADCLESPSGRDRH